MENLVGTIASRPPLAFKGFDGGVVFWFLKLIAIKCFVHNVKKMDKYSSKILWCLHSQIFKVYWIIHQHYA